ncbi:DUF1440 domain-containing protein [Acidipila sp. EB88]|uniref:DUF1440 domain-containing protein n=1 Tax=Acidipila sp. EB88 TaxID=2305226 RepID=UPI000F5E9AA4|nr:DUF1440 domain-containing protein [Acidipila sp. EB88]
MCEAAGRYRPRPLNAVKLLLRVRATLDHTLPGSAHQNQNMEILNHGRRLVAFGLLAGALGGVAGGVSKLVGELIYPPRTQGQKPPPAILAEKVAGHSLSKPLQTLATQAFHWTFSVGIGAVYGAAAEFAPIVTAGYGIVFGEVVLLSTHESILPLLGLNEPPLQQPAREQKSEILTHAMYGMSVEAVRRLLMRRWKRRSAIAAS